MGRGCPLPQLPPFVTRERKVFSSSFLSPKLKKGWVIKNEERLSC
jgi:hypothetical protein